MDDNKIVITDNNGEENVFEILFTYEDEENGNKYVMYYSEEDDEQIFASRYDGDNHLYDIEDPAEWERLEEVLEDYNMHDEEETERLFISLGGDLASGSLRAVGGWVCGRACRRQCLCPVARPVRAVLCRLWLRDYPPAQRMAAR